MFLHHIHSLPPNDPVNQIFQQQKLLPYEKNWWNTVSSLLHQYELSDTDYAGMEKDEWKSIVDSHVKDYAFAKLLSECKSMTKTYHLHYEVFERQSYITACPSNIAKMVFQIPGRIINCRDNHHTSNPITTCRLCQTYIETQNHIINCKKVCSSDDIISLQTYMCNNFEIELEQLQKIEARIDLLK